MGLGGISVWQLVIILIVFLLTLIVAAPIHRRANGGGEQESEHESYADMQPRPDHREPQHRMRQSSSGDEPPIEDKPEQR